eukprot:jgi/Mesen1/6013/ME000306S05271
MASSNGQMEEGANLEVTTTDLQEQLLTFSSRVAQLEVRVAKQEKDKDILEAGLRGALLSMMTACRQLLHVTGGEERREDLADAASAGRGEALSSAFRKLNFSSADVATSRSAKSHTGPPAAGDGGSGDMSEKKYWGMEQPDVAMGEEEAVWGAAELESEERGAVQLQLLMSKMRPPGGLTSNPGALLSGSIGSSTDALAPSATASCGSNSREASGAQHSPSGRRAVYSLNSPGSGGAGRPRRWSSEDTATERGAFIVSAAAASAAVHQVLSPRDATSAAGAGMGLSESLPPGTSGAHAGVPPLSPRSWGAGRPSPSSFRDEGGAGGALLSPARDAQGGGPRFADRQRGSPTAAMHDLLVSPSSALGGAGGGNKHYDDIMQRLAVITERVSRRASSFKMDRGAAGKLGGAAGPAGSGGPRELRRTHSSTAEQLSSAVSGASPRLSSPAQSIASEDLQLFLSPSRPHPHHPLAGSGGAVRHPPGEENGGFRRSKTEAFSPSHLLFRDSAEASPRGRREHEGEEGREMLSPGLRDPSGSSVPAGISGGVPAPPAELPPAGEADGGAENDAIGRSAGGEAPGLLDAEEAMLVRLAVLQRRKLDLLQRGGGAGVGSAPQQESGGAGAGAAPPEDAAPPLFSAPEPAVVGFEGPQGADGLATTRGKGGTSEGQGQALAPAQAPETPQAEAGGPLDALLLDNLGPESPLVDSPLLFLVNSSAPRPSGEGDGDHPLPPADGLERRSAEVGHSAAAAEGSAAEGEGGPHLAGSGGSLPLAAPESPLGVSGDDDGNRGTLRVVAVADGSPPPSAGTPGFSALNSVVPAGRGSQQVPALGGAHPTGQMSPRVPRSPRLTPRGSPQLGGRESPSRRLVSERSPRAFALNSPRVAGEAPPPLDAASSPHLLSNGSPQLAPKGGSPLVSRGASPQRGYTTGGPLPAGRLSPRRLPKASPHLAAGGSPQVAAAGGSKSSSPVIRGIPLALIVAQESPKMSGQASNNLGDIAQGWMLDNY